MLKINTFLFWLKPAREMNQVLGLSQKNMRRQRRMEKIWNTLTSTYLNVSTSCSEPKTMNKVAQSFNAWMHQVKLWRLFMKCWKNWFLIAAGSVQVYTFTSWCLALMKKYASCLRTWKSFMFFKFLCSKAIKTFKRWG